MTATWPQNNDFQFGVFPDTILPFMESIKSPGLSAHPGPGTTLYTHSASGDGRTNTPSGQAIVIATIVILFIAVAIVYVW